MDIRENCKTKDNECNAQHIHHVVCSASCNHEEHERTGFSNSNYLNFSKESINEQVNCSIKKYLDLQDTLF